MKFLYFLPLCMLLFMSCSKNNDETSADETMSFQSKKGTITFKVITDDYFLIGNKNDIDKIRQKESDNFIAIDETSCILHKTVKGNKFYKRAQVIQNQYPQCRIEPVLSYSDSSEQILKGEINLKLNPNTPTPMPKEITDKGFTITPDQFVENQYLLTSNYSTEEIFSFVNTLQNVKGIAFAEPNFIRLLKVFP